MKYCQTQKESMMYEIQVAGRIDPQRADWFGAMTFALKHAQDGSIITVLCGKVADQAALFGILNTIRNLGMKLISVNRIEVL